MPTAGKRERTLTEVVLGIAIALLIILLLLAVWSFFQGTLGFADALGVAGFSAVMVGVLVWASLLSRSKSEDRDAIPARKVK